MHEKVVGHGQTREKTDMYFWACTFLSLRRNREILETQEDATKKLDWLEWNWQEYRKGQHKWGLRSRKFSYYGRFMWTLLVVFTRIYFVFLRSLCINFVWTAVVLFIFCIHICTVSSTSVISMQLFQCMPTLILLWVIKFGQESCKSNDLATATLYINCFKIFLLFFLMYCYEGVIICMMKLLQGVPSIKGHMQPNSFILNKRWLATPLESNFYFASSWST